MDNINRKSKIIRIVEKSLGYIDERLIDHGVRVAYIADAVASAMPESAIGVDNDTLMILCLLHDIGAYKTEEIDHMVAFETGSVFEHAAYGYAFLHNATPLGEASEAVLYHHLDYSDSVYISSAYMKAASLIFLADRLDILLAANERDFRDNIVELSGEAFDPELVRVFLEVEDSARITEKIKDGSYRQIIDDKLRSLGQSESRTIDYLKMLVYSIDFRSPFTVTHTSNTTCISVVLGELMGFTEAELQALWLGAFMHDIGKIAVPYAILEKPGKLDADEMKAMRAHVLVSGEILSGFVSDEILQIAVRHHEKIDGSGYPYGLKGDELTISQRIAAVADIISALINRRSYKEPFSKDDTMQIIEKMMNAGQLCPTVCGIVLQRYDYIMDRVRTYDNPVVSMYEKLRSEYLSSLDSLRNISKKPSGRIK